MHQILIALSLFKDCSSMILFQAHFYGFHQIKLLFICCWIGRRCGELQPGYSTGTPNFYIVSRLQYTKFSYSYYLLKHPHLLSG